MLPTPAAPVTAFTDQMILEEPIVKSGKRKRSNAHKTSEGATQDGSSGGHPPQTTTHKKRNTSNERHF